MSHLLDPLTSDDPRPANPNPDAHKKPTSAARQAASRANGARSRGPVTPEGKARSSQNALKHGLLADVLVLETEDPEVFEAFARELHDYLRPTNPIAKMLVDDLVAAHWRRNRLRRIEAETYNIAIENSIPNSIDDQHAFALAFRNLTDATTLQLLNRYERGFDRLIARTLRLLPKWNQPDNETAACPEPAPDPEVEPQTPEAPAPGPDLTDREEPRGEASPSKRHDETNLEVPYLQQAMRRLVPDRSPEVPNDFGRGWQDPLERQGGV